MSTSQPRRFNLSQAIAILANVGVIVGIVFLSLEINQSNRIAVYDARRALIDDFVDLARVPWADPDVAALMLKLSEPGAELSPLEEYRALSLARSYVTRAADVMVAYESGFIPAAIFPRFESSWLNLIRQSPGLAGFIRIALEESGLNAAYIEEGPNLFRVVLEEIERLEPQ